MPQPMPVMCLGGILKMMLIFSSPESFPAQNAEQTLTNVKGSGFV